MKADGSGTNVRIHLVAADPKYISAIALAVSLLCAFYAFTAGNKLSQYVYWMQREESFTEQLSSQGIKVPQDILDHIKKEHEK